MKDKLKSGFFIVSLLIILFLAGKVIYPYASYIFGGIIIAFILRPMYLWLLKYIRRPTQTALLMIFIVFLFILAPIILLATTIINQSRMLIANLNQDQLAGISTFFSEHLNMDVDVQFYVNEGVIRLQDMVLRESFSFLGQIFHVAIGLVIMFFVMYYLFKQGHEISQAIIDVLPLKKDHKQVLLDEAMLVTNAVIYGQVTTALAQGAVALLGFFIFGIPNPLLWGLLIVTVSFFPVIGTPVVFIPIGISELVQGDIFSGMGILIYGFIFIMNIDDIIKPLIISEKSRLNPALIIIGVFGGVKSFGIVGFVLGPIILALLIVFLKVFRQDFKPSEELTRVRKQDYNKLIVPLRIRPPDGHRHDEPSEKDTPQT